MSKFSDWNKSIAIAGVGVTGKMIAENMLHRTIGKTMSKVTVPLFVLSLAVSGGYYASERIDPNQGSERFTYAIFNPKEAAIETAMNIASLSNVSIEHFVAPDLETGQPHLAGQIYQMFKESPFRY